MNKKWLFIPGVALGLSTILVFIQGDPVVNDDVVGNDNVNDVVIDYAKDLSTATGPANISEINDNQLKQVSTANRSPSEMQDTVETKTESEAKTEVDQNQQPVDHLAAAFPDTSKLLAEEIGNTDEDELQQQQQEEEIEAERARVEMNLNPPVEASDTVVPSETEMEYQRNEQEQRIAQEALALEEQEASLQLSESDTDLPPMEQQH